MSFFEYDVIEYGGLPKDYFANIASDILYDIETFDFRLVDKPDARFYSAIYAEARLKDIQMRQDLAVDKKIKQELINEHDKWHKAIMQSKSGDYSRLRDVLDEDSESLMQDEGSFKYGVALGELTDILRENF